MERETQKGEGMLVLTDTDPAISSEDFLQFEEILGKKLPKSMMDFYLKYNGGQPQVRGVHDDRNLFPFNSFDSLEEMRKSLPGLTMRLCLRDLGLQTFSILPMILDRVTMLFL